MEFQLLAPSKEFETLPQDHLICVQDKFKEIKKIKNFNVFSSNFIGILVLSALIFSISLEESNAQSVASVLDKTPKVLIENLNEDVSLPSWHLEEGQTMYVNIINSNAVSEKKIDVIKNAILSHVVTVRTSSSPSGEEGLTYYMGWQGALNKASEELTQFTIPKNIEIIDSSITEAQISIVLSTEKNLNGYTGYAWLTSNDDQILKSIIKIYDVNDLTERDLASITRHEFGHALGLPHSSLPDDLMFNLIHTQYPYISDYHITSLRTIYGDQDSGDAELFTLPQFKQIAKVKISGTIKDYQLGTLVTVKITAPDGSVQELPVLTPTDDFTVFYLLDHSSVTGEYSVDVLYDGSVVGTNSFSVIEKEPQNETNGSKHASIIPVLDNGGWPEDVKWKRYQKIDGAWTFVGYE